MGVNVYESKGLDSAMMGYGDGCGGGCEAICAGGFRGNREHAGRSSEIHERGQMTVELAAIFPVLIIVAAISVNVLTFFSECASFDRQFAQAVRVCASSPAYGETAQGNAGLVSDRLAVFRRDYLEVSVLSESVGSGHVEYIGELVYSPTLFGMGLRSEVFGVSLPKLTHVASYVIDPYKAGVVA